MGETFENIGYASEYRARSIWKFMHYEDKGALKIDKGKIEFTGRKNNIQTNKVKQVYLSNVKPSSVLTILLFYFLTLIVLLLFYLEPTSTIGFVFWVGLFALIGFFGTYIESNEVWIVVEYLDNKRLRKAYFICLGARWNGLRKTKKLYESL